MDIEFDPNYHKARVLFQDLPPGKEYHLTVKELAGQLKRKIKTYSIKPSSKKEYATHCILLEDCCFNETIILKDLEQEIPTGHQIDFSFTPSLVTKYKECMNADHLHDEHTAVISFVITNATAQGGSRKWYIKRIKRKDNV